MKKKIKAKAKRLTLKQRLADAHENGRLIGISEGDLKARNEFRPNYLYQTGVTDFVQMVGSWPIAEDGVVQIAGTDLKQNVTAMIPVRLFRAIATELKRLGYEKAAHSTWNKSSDAFNTFFRT